jgi:hypothetical protein
LLRVMIEEKDAQERLARVRFSFPHHHYVVWILKRRHPGSREQIAGSGGHTRGPFRPAAGQRFPGYDDGHRRRLLATAPRLAREYDIS